MKKRENPIRETKEKNLVILRPLWNKFVEKTIQEFSASRVKPFNWTHLSDINGLCLIVFGHARTDAMPRGAVYQLSLIRPIFTIYFHKQRMFTIDSNNIKSVEMPTIELLDHSNDIDVNIMNRLIFLSKNIFPRMKQVQIDDFNEDWPFKKVRSRLFSSVL